MELSDTMSEWCLLPQCGRLCFLKMTTTISPIPCALLMVCLILFPSRVRSVSPFSNLARMWLTHNPWNVVEVMQYHFVSQKKWGSSCFAETLMREAGGRRSLTALKLPCWKEAQTSLHGETQVETPRLHEERGAQPALSCSSPWLLQISATGWLQP